MSNELDPKYSKYYSEDAFWKKIKDVIVSAGLELVYKAAQLFFVLSKPECPMHIKAAIVGALGYFIFPLDVIPDFTPVVGYSDDLATITTGLVMAQMYVDDEVKHQAKQAIDKIFGEGTSAGLD